MLFERMNWFVVRTPPPTNNLDVDSAQRDDRHLLPWVAADKNHAHIMGEFVINHDHDFVLFDAELIYLSF